MGLMVGGRGREVWAGRLTGWRKGGFNLGESYGFKALHFEKYKPQMMRPESRLWRACTRMPAGIRGRGVENPQGFGVMNADLTRREHG